MYVKVHRAAEIAGAPSTMRQGWGVGMTGLGVHGEGGGGAAGGPGGAAAGTGVTSLAVATR